MPWIVLDTDLRHHRKLACLSEDAARWGWIVTLLEAKRQRRPGTFASTEHLAYVLGDDLSTFIEEYVKSKLLERKRNGSLVVHDWDDYQRDPTGAVRQARYRDRHRNVTSNDEVTATRARARPVAVPVPVHNDDGERVQGEGAETEPWLRAWLGVRHRMPTPGQQRVIDAFLETFDVTGPERLGRLILEHSDDPLGAVIKELKSFRTARLSEIDIPATPPRRPRSGLDPVGDELKQEWAKQFREKAESVA